MSNSETQPTAARRRLISLAFAVAIGGAAAALTPLALAHGFGGHGGLGGWHGGPVDPQRIERRVDHVLSDVGASAEQKQKVTSILQSAAQELEPLRAQHREARKQTRTLLSAPTINREQLESLRIEQMRLADGVSKRFTQALVDAAEVLTPEQRAALAKKMEERRARRHG
jgi:protein CpxP